MTNAEAGFAAKDDASARRQVKNVGRRLIWCAAQVPLLRGLVMTYYDRRPTENGWTRRHPFDLAEGVRTSGVLPGFVLKRFDPLDTPTVAYGAAQPSTIRTALSTIPRQGDCDFLDYGCGKGRPLLIAAECGFASVTGVEFSPPLARIAQRNAKLFARRHPGFTPIKVICGDALAHPLPERDTVLFLNNPFGVELMRRLVAEIAKSLSERPRRFYIIYFNPAWAEVFDAEPAFERRFAAQLPYAEAERGFGPHLTEALVVWQDRGNQNPRPAGDPERPINIHTPGWHVEIG